MAPARVGCTEIYHQGFTPDSSGFNKKTFWEETVKAEIQVQVDKIKQSLELLRRHL